MQGIRSIICATAVLLLTGAAHGQMPTEAVGEGDFPGLQLLPPGSVLKGISIPRYENHRVASLITADRLEVRTNSLIALINLRAFLYDKNREAIELTTDELVGDFSSKRLTAPGKVSLSSPKFQARGEGFVYSQTRDVGIIKGPVHTSIRTDLMGGPTPEPKKK